MFKNSKIVKKIGAGFMAGLCTISMLTTAMSGVITAHAASETKEEVFPSADKIIAQAATLLGSPYAFGCKGYTGIYYQDSYKPLDAGEVRAQIVIALAISNAAMTKKYCSPSVSHSDNMRYSFRVWLLNLVLIGDEYKNCRTHLLKHLTGDIAWRHPEDGVAQRERLRQERIAAREQEQRNEPPCDERVATVCDDRQEVGEIPDENWEATVSDCDDFEETEDEGMAMSM